VLGAWKPRLPLALIVPVEISGEAGASRPLAILALQGQQPRAPALPGHLCALRRDNLSRRLHQIVQDLPADGGIRIQQPVHHGHAGDSNT
jgi:hypothetical protein